MTATRRLLAGLAGLAMLALAGCGNDPSRSEGFSAARGLISGAVGRSGGGDAAASGQISVDTNPAAAIAAVLRGQQGPVMFIALNGGSEAALLGRYGQNGPYRTWATNDRQSLTFFRGILTATRGIGGDLMSSEVGAVAPLIIGRRAGTGQRTYRYLDGENKERPLQLSCTVQPAGPATATLASGQSFAATRVDEVCQAGSLTVRNIYFVTASGFIPQSRQWQGPGNGDIAIQILRN